VREALERLECSWAGSRRQVRKDSEHKERLANVAKRIGSFRPETTVLFAKQTEIKRFPPLRRMSQPVGAQEAVSNAYPSAPGRATSKNRLQTSAPRPSLHAAPRAER
jgi:hypothetical protein